MMSADKTHPLAVLDEETAAAGIKPTAPSTTRQNSTSRTLASHNISGSKRHLYAIYGMLLMYGLSLPVFFCVTRVTIARDIVPLVHEHCHRMVREDIVWNDAEVVDNVVSGVDIISPIVVVSSSKDSAQKIYSYARGSSTLVDTSEEVENASERRDIHKSVEVERNSVVQYVDPAAAGEFHYTRSSSRLQTSNTRPEARNQNEATDSLTDNTELYIPVDTADDVESDDGVVDSRNSNSYDDDSTDENIETSSPIDEYSGESFLEPMKRVKRSSSSGRGRKHSRTESTTSGSTDASSNRRSRKPKKRPQHNRHAEHLRANRVIHLHSQPTSNRQYTSPSLISLNYTGTTDTIYRFWRKAAWVPGESDDTFRLNEESGAVFIRKPGLYLIYAQMVYHDLAGRWSFGIYVDAQERIKCLASEQLRHGDQFHPTNHGVYKSCYTAAPVFVSSEAMVNIRCMYGSRTILTQPEFTFWGIVKLS